MANVNHFLKISNLILRFYVIVLLLLEKNFKSSNSHISDKLNKSVTII